MREYASTIEGSMFDFEDYYLKVAATIPSPARVVEVGLGNGKSCIFLAEAILNAGKEIEHFVAVDNCDYGNVSQRNEIIKNLVNSGLGSQIEFLEMSSLDASTKFPDGYFHFVFVDSSHKYSQTKAEIRLWQHKLLHDGVLAGHDIFSSENKEVAQAVKEIIPANRLLTQTTRGGHGVWITVKNDNLPCF
jgi:predicted O-methyltransferase YrrM